MLQITTQRTTTPKAKPDESNLGFGVHYTDHMLIIDLSLIHISEPTRH